MTGSRLKAGKFTTASNESSIERMPVPSSALGCDRDWLVQQTRQQIMKYINRLTIKIDLKSVISDKHSTYHCRWRFHSFEFFAASEQFCDLKTLLNTHSSLRAIQWCIACLPPPSGSLSFRILRKRIATAEVGFSRQNLR